MFNLRLSNLFFLTRSVHSTYTVVPVTPVIAIAVDLNICVFESVRKPPTHTANTDTFPAAPVDRTTVDLVACCYQKKDGLI